MAPDQRSSQMRKWVAGIQGLCGIFAIACGIALIPLIAPDEAHYTVTYSSSLIAKIGFGIWGGLTILVTAILGVIYRKSKTMTNIYASFSVVSMTMAVVIICVASTALVRFAQSPNRYNRCGDYYYDYDDCCLSRYGNGCERYADYFYQPSDPYKDYESEECLLERERKERELERERLICEDKLRKNRSANLAVLSILCIVSVVGLIDSFIAVIIGFKFGCQGCCQTPEQQVVYLAYPPNAQPGSAPVVVLPNSIPGSAPLQVAGMVPNAAPYQYGVAGINTNVSAVSHPYPLQLIHPAVAPQMMTGTVQVPDSTMPRAMNTDPPPMYEVPDVNRH